jgi:hypothetical protein
MKPNSLTIIKLIFILLSINPAYSLYFDLQGAKERCFVEEFYTNNVNIAHNKR